MKREYFRVRPKYDCLPRFLKDSQQTDGAWIANELYTKGELAQYFAPANMFVRELLSTHNIYWFFGARFYDKDYYREDDSDEQE